MLTDSLMVFVVLQLKDAPESGLDGLGDYLRYRGLGLLCVIPKISKHVANFYWKSSGEREPPEGRAVAGGNFGGSESEGTWLPRGIALFLPKHST